MPRVNHVKRAQQRYATKPVIDPATGVQKVTPVMNTRTGEPKVTKRGRPVVLRVTERDLERPLPMPTCDYPQCKHDSREIAVGTPYKWIEPSGQRVRNRHGDCPTWKVWEYSSSLSARIAQITDEIPADFESKEEAEQWLSDKAQEIRDLAEEKRESASNIEEGFGHATYQSEELNETADSLESWADEVEQTDLPDIDLEDAEEECPDCDGTGKVTVIADEVECGACLGTGHIVPDEPSEVMTQWNEEVRQAIDDALGNCPV